MHVQYVVLCDQVILGTDGRPSLIGIFNDVQLPELPLRVPRLSFGARMLFTADECGKKHQVEVVVTDASGKELGRQGGELALPMLPADVDSLAVDLPVPFDFFEVTAWGRHTFLLHVDGTPAAAAQLIVRKSTVS